MTAAINRVKLKALDKAKILKGAEVKILPFTNRKQTGINTITFLPIAELPSFEQDQPLLTPAIHSGQQDDAKQSTLIDFLPVIEGDPNDHNTIFTTLMRLSEDKVTIVTFDLPIWLKAVDIIKQANLPIIPRLGGFHLLKSYLGSLGGRTPALWVQYHYMVDVIKIFIRTERLADHNGHLSCIVTRMLDIFAAVGHHQYTKWFEEINPFDQDRDKELLVSFSTGFTSTRDDPVNAERAAEVGREMQIKLDGRSATSTMEVKLKVQALSSLRKIPKVNEKKIHLDSLKLFNRLIILAQRAMTVETSLQ
ncbi:hypothetical protein D5F01_LYC11105 [Larimichthys crocea]|uniref:Uncharacterized protein n=1 Tax=Larimichthys crocea TaxID=215358 RepID=A0A6G0IJJ0_LARCR|nr:hypothetical protein D5F01_LYC11105 [Larimichthys crocea]